MKVENAHDFFRYINDMLDYDTHVQIVTFNMAVFGKNPLNSVLDKLEDNPNHRIIVSVPPLSECKPGCVDCRKKYNSRIERLKKHAETWNVRFIRDTHLKYYKIGERAFIGGVNLSPSDWIDSMVELQGEDKSFYNNLFQKLWSKAEKNVKKVPVNAKTPITTKQFKFIQAIESELNVEFEGDSKECARDFISKHVDAFHKKTSS